MYDAVVVRRPTESPDTEVTISPQHQYNAIPAGLLPLTTIAATTLMQSLLAHTTLNENIAVLEWYR
jgi:hypothetical protein